MFEATLHKPTSVGKTITVAVAGNPNAGKSTLINAIAGTRLHVGNWAGVTVEKKEATFNFQQRDIRLVDLPGTYSLTPYSQEEIIARDFLTREKPDCIIDVVDATNLERNLNLTIQLMELDIPVVIAMNIYDEATKRGDRIDTEKMAHMLGVAVIPTVAKKKVGVDKLLAAVVAAVDDHSSRPKRLTLSSDIDAAAGYLQDKILTLHPEAAGKYPLTWLPYKLMESDAVIIGEFRSLAVDGLVAQATEHIRGAHGENVAKVLADARYSLAAGLTREILAKPDTINVELTEKIDSVALNKLLGIPLFLFAMWLMFKLTFDLSSPFSDWLNTVISGPLTRWVTVLLTLAGAPQWCVSLTTEGVIGGVGIVFMFFPIIFSMMFFITFLEGSGYMARAAFVMDGVMHTLGLHGKSFIPMLLGFGCNVPAIYATRTLESEKDKILTALLIPLTSCSARLPVYVLFVGIFFDTHSGTVLWSLYVLGIVLAVLMGNIFKNTLFKGEQPMFIMELPPYRLPSLHNLMIHSWEKAKHFIIKAGTYIFAMSVLVWFLFNLPWGVQSKRDSYLGRAGQALTPIFEPLGFGEWEAVSSLITGVIAKEIIVSTMGEIYANENTHKEMDKDISFADDVRQVFVSFFQAGKESLSNLFSTFNIASIASKTEGDEDKQLQASIRTAFSPLSAYAFMAFVLLYMPCMVTAVAFKHEFGTWKWFGVALVYGVALAWVVALLIYQTGTFLKIGG
ncbi:ferrous iron transport protein B [Candidatus Magnetobacterium casense]|uniref:Ferrous iron transport protein B n=1 Tax=Candidatus Magnetobacterium casense TaxID=1455061 RepID=A0ABS6S1W0_9BACT|nr:ferrous iron transport protein B [Candidatus Magnetobacterium casensis]MBV6342842.1 ferrous iron transport protein B [Candidatus Magnetobacterium casensis]